MAQDLTPTVTITNSTSWNGKPAIDVWVTFPNAGVDQPQGPGWELGPKHQKLAERLKAAILAGKALTVEGVTEDVHGKTYVRTRVNVLGRTLNADLTRMGF